MSEMDKINGANWMSGLCSNLPITAINMPGTHDSATKYVRFAPICNTQNLTIEEQLQIGVRYLDMRFELKGGRKLVAVHSIADCKKERGLNSADLTAADTVNMCESFLKANLGETILFQLKEDDGDAGIALFGEFYEQCIRGREELWYLENRIPALGEVRGKIVLLRVVGVDASHFDDKTCGVNFSAYPYVGSRDILDFRHRDIKKLSDGETYAHMYVQDSYKLGGIKKWKAVTAFLESDLDPRNFNICLTSCTGFITPKAGSAFINRRLKEYKFISGRHYGIVAADHISPDICRAVFMSNYGTEQA